MGIAYSDAALLARAKKNKVCFEKILTIGHQKLCLSQKQIEHLDKIYDIKMGKADFSKEQYADAFFKIFLGATNVMSLDHDNYEGCDIIHDMNEPIKPEYNEIFDVVIDGGSLEHIFNFPVAITNCMKMIKKGGSIFVFSIADNHFGHGFYQFSPELYFRIFQPTNGFKIQDVIIVKHPFPGLDLSSRVKCYSVVDPAFVNKRVGLVSKTPVSIMVHAVRTEIKPIFATYPIQSDYLLKWNRRDRQNRYIFSKTSMKNLIKRCFLYLPLRCRNYIEGKWELFVYSFSNKQFYKEKQLF